jgi:hypothetical protein
MSPLSGVLGEAWDFYKRFAGHFLLIAFAIYVVAGVIAALLGLAGGIGFFLGWLINLVAAFLVQAALVKAVQDVRDGRADLNLGETVSAVLPFLLPVIAASILAGIGIAIGFVLIIVPGLILLTFWSLIVPSIVIGGEGVFSSFGKSWRTVRGFAWNVFGTYVLVFLILIAFNIVLGLVLLVLPVAIRNLISNVVSGTLVAPFLALVVTLVYYRLAAAHGVAAAEGGEATMPPSGGSYPPPEGTYPPPEGTSPPPEGTSPPPEGTSPPPEGTTSPETTMPPGSPMPPPPSPTRPPGSPPPETPA